MEMMENADEAPRFPPSHRARYERPNENEQPENQKQKGRRSADRPIDHETGDHPAVLSCRHPAVLVDAGHSLEDSDAFTAAMVEYLRKSHQIDVFGLIEPARQQVLEDHHPTEMDLAPILFASSFVPAGRELIFAQAFVAGFRGDFLVATHLIVFQIEEATRQILKSRGVPTTKLDEEGVEDEQSLGNLLRMQETGEILGPALHLQLVCLLTHRFGWNLRNTVAHGQVDHDEFTSVPTIYLWWLVLRIVITSAHLSERAGTGQNG